jgi:thiosulfate dehydrogenase
MSTGRDATRTHHTRWWMMTIAFALACGRTDAPAATGHETAATPQVPSASVTADTAFPTGAMGDAVRRGHALLASTRDSLPSHVGSTLRCFSCHLDEGRRASALPLTRSYTNYPQYRARRARVDLIEDRINDCFVRSLNGRALNDDGGDMRDIVTFLAWMSRGVAAGDVAPAHGASSLSALEADTARGAVVFAANCVRCHGASGQGTVVAPPLWGPNSFTIGAGMARYRTAAQFVLHNMPFDRPNTLTPQQALDVARYIGSRPRPDLVGKENDWPKGDAPSDLPYSTRAGSAGADTARARAHNGAR